jgi:hypothetical protein
MGAMSSRISGDEVLSAEIVADLEAAASRAAGGARDADSMSRACQRMDRVREEILRRHGVVDIGMSAIRELRDGE